MSILFKKDGIYKKEWKYDEEINKGDFVETKLEETIFAVLPYLSSSVEFEEQFTIEDFFKLMNRDKDLAFLSILTGTNPTAFIKELSEELSQEDREKYEGSSEAKLTHLLFEKVVEILDYTKNKDTVIPGLDLPELSQEEQEQLPNNSLSDFVSCTGLSDQSDEHYSIIFTHWSILKHLQIKLSKEALCYDDFLEGTHEEKSKKIYYDITLYEFLHSFMTELCFFLSPEERDSESQELTLRASEQQSAKEQSQQFDNLEHIKKQSLN